MDARVWGILLNSFWKIFIKGIQVTIPLTLISFFFAMVIALVTAMIQYSKVPVLKSIVRFYIWIIRGTPLLVQLLVVYFGLPNIGIKFEAFDAAVIVFSINEGAYCSETMRAALESVPVGQLEAGYCAGMNYLQIMSRVVIPQALRTAFPPLSNSLIGMVKDTSLASSITVAEMLMQTQRIISLVYEPMALYLEVALVYLIFSTVLTWLQHYGEKKLNAYDGSKL